MPFREGKIVVTLQESADAFGRYRLGITDGYHFQGTAWTHFRSGTGLGTAFPPCWAGAPDVPRHLGAHIIGTRRFQNSGTPRILIAQIVIVHILLASLFLVYFLFRGEEPF